MRLENINKAGAADIKIRSCRKFNLNRDQMEMRAVYKRLVIEIGFYVVLPEILLTLCSLFVTFDPIVLSLKEL